MQVLAEHLYSFYLVINSSNNNTMEQLTVTLGITFVIALGLYIYTFTPSGKRWTGEVRDTRKRK
ncbi:hypothetical protein Barb7_01159 [Bacteroidales bacterium Barb7]|nr:hypothetical protein Barb7_01159 [Bacteroidales bacterium Barb7]